MKKLLILFFLLFVFISTTFSIETYKIDSATIRVNNTLAKECTTLYVWQPWQKIVGTISIDESNKVIVLNINDNVSYNYELSNRLNVDKSITITSYMMNNKTELSLFYYVNSYYFYINDYDNQIELYYKINKIDI